MLFFRAAAALLGLALVSAAVPAAAQTPKSPPSGRLYGYLYVDGAFPESGTPIYAYAGGTFCGQNSYDPTPFGGRYFVDLDSSRPACNQAGAEIVLIVGSCVADESGTVPAFNGAQRLDLSAPGSC